MKKIICIIISAAILISFCACLNATADGSLSAVFINDTADFSASLLKLSGAGEGSNVIFSPVSILIALAMTANGAKGETLEQMMNVIGKNQTTEQLNESINALSGGLPNENNCKVSFANSIWIKDDGNLTVNNDFLQINNDFYRAGVFKEPFDGETLQKINKWTEEKTDGRIEKIIDNINEEAALYLINAIAFDAEWEESFNEKQTREMDFRNADGTTEKTDFMVSVENSYIKLKNASGFVKDYVGGRYKYVALLPDTEVSLKEFIADLDGKLIPEILNKAKKQEVDIYMPGFTAEYENELNDELIQLGILTAFNEEKADFTGMAVYKNNNICIGCVRHKAFIEVGEKGTKASAATVVEMYKESSVSLFEKQRTVITFNRPFLYMIIDSETDIPLFIGTMEKPE